jgi:hypothetical protein
MNTGCTDIKELMCDPQDVPIALLTEAKSEKIIRKIDDRIITPLEIW